MALHPLSVRKPGALEETCCPYHKTKRSCSEMKDVAMPPSSRKPHQGSFWQVKSAFVLGGSYPFSTQTLRKAASAAEIPRPHPDGYCLGNGATYPAQLAPCCLGEESQHHASTTPFPAVQGVSLSKMAPSKLPFHSAKPRLLPSHRPSELEEALCLASGVLPCLHRNEMR